MRFYDPQTDFYASQIQLYDPQTEKLTSDRLYFFLNLLNTYKLMLSNKKISSLIIQKKRGDRVHDFFKVFFINLVCDIDNMLILGAILRRHSYLNMTIPAAIVLTFMRTVYVILINEGLSGVPLFQLLTGLILLFIAFKVVTMTISGEDLLSRNSTRSPKSTVKILLLLMGTDFLISLDSVFVISGISQTIFPVATGIFGSLMISLLFMSIIIRLAKAFFWINIIAGGFIAQNAMIGMSKDPWLADWISQINQSFPNVNIVNIAANGAVILIVVIGVYSYIKHHRIIIDK
ncbi:hypothetical protein B5V88_04355 [Heyndrickxia sporothermodurans]|uniref:TerC family protein n=2 Tax=Heyndrickxia sporothermodurans TaxID=46224 RepID=UPI000D394EE8|nr:hypothetical protein [Heyndrickxia sporothermodurans]MBL5810576.1 hypothetical protein [Heyndrickxia sporothermodurans]MBL5848799.1 hypothetical protein [Heyndrickxia sporothermodurans]MBL5869172.1 hypothetical protein [Heyndrickxia sporothermodurans]PTY81415.1 hypothetical protein B5V88_04355 [Heyndrickxia sporothermodurans]PTY93315.1 hypothetical protein B5V90_01810 [Heyndrickxia sporothermodurans]